MSLLPRSLFSRLVLVLLSGLLAAQLLSFAIHMHERRETLMQASGLQSAQRIADIVRLLESTGTAERQRIAGVLSTPPMTVRLDQPAIAASPDPERRAQAALFAAFLQRQLGEAWPVKVVVTDPGSAVEAGSGMHGPMRGHGFGPAMSPPMGMRPGLRYQFDDSLAFIAQVRLGDGTLVSFDTRQPADMINWPFRMLASLLVLLAAVIAVSLLAVRWATRPLNVLAEAAEQLGKNIHRPPLPETGPQEVSRAARAFNRMQELLIRYMQDRARIFAAMSHDLKTPITRLRLRAEMLDDARLREQFTGDLGEMEALVSTTLDYLRGINDDAPPTQVDMQALLESLQENLHETGGTVEIDGAAIGPYWGKPQSLKRCLGNLLENAVKYGKSVRVRVIDSREQLEIRIADQGPGIPEAELEKVFEPYYRIEASRNRQTGGTGLGLSIARSIAQAHGGTLRLVNRAEGGLEARLVLPRSR